MCYPDGKVDSARKSFPSGHTSMAFAGSTFIALLCYHWLTKWRFSSGFERFNIPGPSIAIAMFFLSYVPAFFTAISRTQVSRAFYPRRFRWYFRTIDILQSMWLLVEYLEQLWHIYVLFNTTKWIYLTLTDIAKLNQQAVVIDRLV